MPAVPYVTAAEFRAHPTYLDLDGLRVGVGTDQAQTAELTNILLMASEWADNKCNQSLGAHHVVQKTRGRFNRDGNLVAHASNGPVLAVSALAYGRTPTTLAAASVADAWIEESQNIVFPGVVGSPGVQVFAELGYFAGWVSALLTADAAVGASSLTVADPTGILPGASYRLWEPGVEETVTVSAAFVPPVVGTPPAATVVPLAAPSLFAHTSGSGWSGMPANMRLAVVNYAASLLMRPDTTAEDDYPDTPLGSSTRKNDPRRTGSGLVAEAARILSSYGRVR